MKKLRREGFKVEGAHNPFLEANTFKATLVCAVRSTAFLRLRIMV
jgi:hypothetical protein